MNDKKQMKRHEFYDYRNEIIDECREIMDQKNHDYSGATDNIFANFKAGEILGIDAEKGILLRCMDKFQRIKAFTDSGDLLVKDEPVDDAIKDVINYMLLLAGIIEEKRRQNSA